MQTPACTDQKPVTLVKSPENTVILLSTTTLDDYSSCEKGVIEETSPVVETWGDEHRDYNVYVVEHVPDTGTEEESEESASEYGAGSVPKKRGHIDLLQRNPENKRQRMWNNNRIHYATLGKEDDIARRAVYEVQHESNMRTDELNAARQLARVQGLQDSHNLEKEHDRMADALNEAKRVARAQVGMDEDEKDKIVANLSESKRVARMQVGIEDDEKDTIAASMNEAKRVARAQAGTEEDAKDIVAAGLNEAKQAARMNAGIEEDRLDTETRESLVSRKHARKQTVLGVLLMKMSLLISWPKRFRFGFAMVTMVTTV